MNIEERLNVYLTDEEVQQLTDGEPLQIPLDERQGLVVIPPREEVDDGE